MKLIDLTGQKFGKLTVIKRGRNHRRLVHWLCKCDCGNMIKVASNCLRYGQTISCKCARTERAIAMGKRNYKGVATAYGRLYKAYKYKAKKRNRVFSLDKKTFSGLISRPCYYCGEIDKKSNYKTGEKFNLNGIDRVDTSVGYIEGNVVSCCWKCNTAKKATTINIARKMLEFIDDSNSVGDNYGG